MNRTHNNGELRINNVNQEVELKGWVSKTRNLGGLIFIDLRDKTGITQVVVGPENSNYELASSVRSEYVIYVKGKVVERSNKNANIGTGEIEINATDFKVINKAETTPFQIADNIDALEDTLLKYRYLDLRRPEKQMYIIKRHEITSAVREFLNSENFLEIETPYLGKSTPEGARDYLVPSRLYKGQFYALPQSPQIYKQLLMISGFEKYYQLAKCFRDEDLRADRQPEFTQIDIETSFLSKEEIMTMTENLLKYSFKKVLNLDIKVPFIRMPYDEAMNSYGSDKPDTRFDMQLVDLTSETRNSGFSVFESAPAVKCINVKTGSDLSRKKIDEMTEFVKKYKAKGLAWLKFENNELTGPIIKFLNSETTQLIKEKTNLENGDMLLFIADTLDIANTALGALRIKVAKEKELIDNSLYNFLWVTDWPLFEYSEEDGRFYAAHHPFTAPLKGEEDLLVSNPKECRAEAYDVVLNGYELGGGSLRIYNQNMQEDMFKTLGFSMEDAKERFGFFIDALKYGTPPHGGIAIGLDRMVMLMTKTDNIKDVVAFPKTQSARDPMMDAPNVVDKAQLDELNLEVKKS